MAATELNPLGPVAVAIWSLMAAACEKSAGPQNDPAPGPSGLSSLSASELIDKSLVEAVTHARVIAAQPGDRSDEGLRVSQCFYTAEEAVGGAGMVRRSVAVAARGSLASAVIHRDCLNSE